MFPPACGTVAGASSVDGRAEDDATPACVVDAEALSLPVLSFGVPVIEAVFVNVNVRGVMSAGTETTIETVAELVPAASVPRLQVTVAVPVHVPGDGVADTIVRPAGSVSVTVTPAAAVLPVCEAVIA